MSGEVQKGLWGGFRQAEQDRFGFLLHGYAQAIFFLNLRRDRRESTFVGDIKQCRPRRHGRLNIDGRDLVMSTGSQNPKRKNKQTSFRQDSGVSYECG